jgi:GGDEF domain-containing protein
VVVGRGPAAAADQVVRRIERDLATPVHITGGAWDGGVSLGVAVAAAGDAAADVLQRADAAMYRHKAARRAGQAARAGGVIE